MKQSGIFMLLAFSLGGCMDRGTVGTEDYDSRVGDEGPHIPVRTSYVTPEGELIVEDAEALDPAVAVTMAFVNDASSNNLKEIEMGKLAVEESNHPGIEAYGRSLTADHALADQKLRMIAERKNIDLPDNLMPSHQTLIDRVEDYTEAEFETSFLQMMIDDHRAAITRFENAMVNITDPDLQAYILETLPVLRKHLIQAEELQRAVNNN